MSLPGQSLFGMVTLGTTGMAGAKVHLMANNNQHFYKNKKKKKKGGGGGKRETEKAVKEKVWFCIFGLLP